MSNQLNPEQRKAKDVNVLKKSLESFTPLPTQPEEPLNTFLLTLNHPNTGKCALDNTSKQATLRGKNEQEVRNGYNSRPEKCACGCKYIISSVVKNPFL